MREKDEQLNMREGKTEPEIGTGRDREIQREPVASTFDLLT